MKNITRFTKIEVENSFQRKKYLHRIDQILKHGKIILGPETIKLEKKLSNYLNAKYCLLTGSGTDSLFVSIKALNFRPGDEIITTPLAWVTTANSIILNNCKPVFADIGDDLNLDIKSIESLINKKTKGLLLVHFAGLPNNMNKIIKLVNKYNLKLIEDCAHSFGSTFQKRHCGTFGSFGCFSLNSMKIFGSFGELGAVITNNKKLYNKISLLRYAGTLNKIDCIQPSLNFKPDSFQSSVMLEKFNNLKSILNKRNNIAKYYTKYLNNNILLPSSSKKIRQSFYEFIIRLKNRDKLKNFLLKNKIESKIETPILIPKQTYYKKKFFVKKNIRNALKLSPKLLCLPIHENLKWNEVKKIVNLVNLFFLKNK
jgi:dTDP-4-amino-4,6-dideoxygalactose transaminase